MAAGLLLSTVDVGADNNTVVVIIAEQVKDE